MKTYVSLIRIVILLGSIVFSSTALALSPPESVECSVELNLPHNQWRQISLPCDPGNATVNDISTLSLDDLDENARRTANYRIGKALNFISATPFVFAREGR